jgi:hypothetical protein
MITVPEGAPFSARLSKTALVEPQLDRRSISKRRAALPSLAEIAAMLAGMKLTLRVLGR